MENELDAETGIGAVLARVIAERDVLVDQVRHLECQLRQIISESAHAPDDIESMRARLAKVTTERDRLAAAIDADEDRKRLHEAVDRLTDAEVQGMLDRMDGVA
jgi:hypothetical protein